jgi:ribosomal protein S26
MDPTPLRQPGRAYRCDNLYIPLTGTSVDSGRGNMTHRKKKNKKWGTYKKSGGRQRSVSCVYCGRTVPRSKATAVQKGMRMGDLRSVGVKRDQLMLPVYKFYACISCAKHRKLLK